MKVQEIIKIITAHFPLSLAVKNDRVGLQVGKNKWIVNKILLALDLTSDVLSEAIENKCNMIIVHHPFFYFSQKKELKNNYKAKIYQKLITEKISVFVTHTSYDQQMNLEILKLIKAYNIKNLFTNDVGKFAILKNESTTNVIEKLKNIFKIKEFQTIMPLPLTINKVAICLGAGGSLIKKISSDYDLFITGELKWNEWILANEKNIPVVCFNHSMENYFIESYFQFLIKNLKKNITILTTKKYLYLSTNL